VTRLDSMLGGGYYRGSSVLVSGTAGSGKSSLASHFVHAACQRGERCLYLSFEESRDQVVRNMRSISLDLEPFLRRDLLRLESSRPTAHGLEMHLAQIHQWVTEYRPRNIVIDPISSLLGAGSLVDTHAMLLRLIDFLKSGGITALFLSLTSGGAELESTGLTVSSLIDTWIVLRDIELAGERNRGLYVLKSRGMSHSNQIREFLITAEGIRLRDVYVGPEGMLTGSMRAAQEARERAAALTRREEVQRKGRELDARRAALHAQVAALEHEVQSLAEEAKISARQAEAAEDALSAERTAAAAQRGGDALGG